MTPSLSHVFLIHEAIASPRWPDADVIKLDSRGPVKPLTVEVPPGTKLFHGTSGGAAFDVPRGPASFTMSQETAEEYARFEHSGGQPVVKAYELVRLVTVISFPSVHDRRAADDARFWLKAFFGVSFKDVGFARAHDSVRAICSSGFDGMLIHEIDSGHPELMLCKPEKLVRHLGDRSVA